MANIQISTRARNIGLGWTNQPVQTRGGLVIAEVTEPRFEGTRNQMLAVHERARRGNSGNDWRYAFFVDGQRVLAVDPMTNVSFLDQLRSLAPGQIVDWPLDDDDVPALNARAAAEWRAIEAEGREWRLANGFATGDDLGQTEETRDNLADALRDFGWTVADYGDPADHYAVHVREDEGDSETPSGYVLSLTKEGMPPFESRDFATVDALMSYFADHFGMYFGRAIWREDGE